MRPAATATPSTTSSPASGMATSKRFTRLGKRLLVGDRAPLLPNDGAKLIEDASARGGAEAAALLAVLFAVGASHQPRSARGACESGGRGRPRLAAGASAARVLAGVPAVTDASGSGAQPDGWQQLAAHGRPSRCGRRRRPRPISRRAPSIRSYASFVSAAVCRWLIDKARGRLSRALVYEALIKKVTVHHTRTNTAALFGLLDTDFVCVLTQNADGRLSWHAVPALRADDCPALRRRGADHRALRFRRSECSRLPAGNRAARSAHRDVLGVPERRLRRRRNGVPARSASATEGRADEGLYFVNALPDGSADVRTLHAGRPAARGEKWIVSQFVRDRAVF